MTDSYKILSQVNAKSLKDIQGTDYNQAQIVYTVPDNTKASVSAIAAINTGSTAQDFSLGVVKQSDVGSSTNTFDQFKDVAYVAVAASGTSALYSTDGISWTTSTLPATLTMSAYGDGKFVALRFDDAAYSTDGTNWTATTIPVSAFWRGAAYGNGVFVAVSNGVAIYSTDGITWSEGTIPSQNWYSVAYGDGKFVAVADGTNSAAYSTDGINWTASTMLSATSDDWQSVAFGNNTFVAVSRGQFGSAQYSSDGINWNYSSIPANYWEIVSHGDNKFVAVVPSTTTAVYSTDGITWTATTLPTSQNWFSMAYGDKFVVLPYLSSTYIYSTDGITWTAGTLPISTSWFSISAKSDIPFTEALSNTQTLVPTRTLPAGTTEEFSGGITLSAGDQIRVYSEDDNISVHVYGVEIS